MAKKFGQKKDLKEEFIKAVGPPANQLTPEQQKAAWEEELNRRTIAAGVNEGVSSTTGKAVPVITIKGLKEQALAGQGAIPRIEQAAQLQALEAQLAGRQRLTEAQTAAEQIGTLTPEQKTKEVVQGEGTIGQLVTAGGAAAGGLYGAKMGAGLGTMVVPGIGTAIGAIGGALIGGTIGAFSKISYSDRQNVRLAFAVYTQSKTNMGWIIDKVNSGQLTPYQAVDMWDEELANFYSAERNLKKATSSDLKRFLSGGADEAAKLEAFKRRLPELEMQLRITLLKPNPTAISNEARLSSVEEE